MSISEFLSDRLGAMLLQILFAAAAAVFLLSTGTQPGVLVLLLIVWLLFFLSAQAIRLVQLRAHLKELESILDGLEQKYLFAGCAPKPKGVYERRLFDLCRRAGQAMATEVSNAQAAQREYREYVEQWVHEIKTPITAARLICRNLEGDTRRRLTYELDQVQAHVERTLFYARVESPERDCVIRQTQLEQIVSQAVGNHRTLLIQSGIRVETKSLDCSVYTDGKWAVFILGQLLQNAARYRGEEPVIALSARPLGKQVQFTVADNGIGIPAHELPRVFDRGFTGTNGRSRGGSTGMGLYLCKRLAACLEIDMHIASTEKQGTVVTLTFPSRENLTKL